LGTECFDNPQVSYPLYLGVILQSLHDAEDNALLKKLAGYHSYYSTCEIKWNEHSSCSNSLLPWLSLS